MKRFIYSSLIVLAGLLTASCAKEDMRVVFDPNDSTAPELGTITGATLAKDGEPLTFEFNLPTFDVQTVKTYSLYAAATEAFTEPTKLAATITADDEEGTASVSVKQSDLNSLVLSLGGALEQEFTVYFRISAWIATDKGSAIESSLKVSNIVAANFVPYDQTILDKDVYTHIWVQGNYCGWDSKFEKCQYLYNYNNDGKTFTGVLDLGGMAADGIKFTDAANWDNGNWGSEAQAEEAEAGSVQLINGGGSKDIKCYSKRFYKFTLDNSTLKLTKDWGADKISITGSFNSWGTDPDIEMNFNSDYVRFWADADFSEDAKIKFRADDAWDLNWGADAIAGGADISVEAGQYRIYLDLNKGTVEINKDMYGKEEPTAGGDEPEPEKPQAWSLIGTIGGSSWDADTDLTNIEGDIWVVRSVTLTASDEFKIRADHAWDICVGGPEANSQSTINASDPYGVYKPTLGVAFETGGKNIQVGADGVYDVTYDYAAGTILIEEHKAVYSLIGQIGGNSWTKDFVMTQDGDVWTSAVVNITGGFKIRYDYNWDNCYGAAEGFTPTVGTAFEAVQPGSDITVPEAGDYKVSFDAAAKTILVEAVAFPETMYMIGADFGGWDWASDRIVDLVPVYGAEGQFWTVRYIKAASPFKFCPAKDWNGKDFCSQTNYDGFTVDNNNCVVDKDGLYLIHIDLKNEKLHVEEARIYGIGECFGGWNEGMEGALFTNSGQTASITIPAAADLRMYVASSIATTDWWTREFIILDGKIVYRGTGDDQTRVACTAGQTVTLDFNAGTGEIK